MVDPTPIVGSEAQLRALTNLLDTNRDNLIRNGEIRRTADTDGDGQLSGAERDALRSRVARATGDANLTRQVLAAADTPVAIEMPLRPTVDWTHRPPLPTTRVAPEEALAPAPGGTPGATVLQAAQPGEPITLRLPPGVELCDTQRRDWHGPQGGWAPPQVRYTDAETGQTRLGTLVSLTNGRQFVLPVGQELLIDRPQGHTEAPGSPTEYNVTADGTMTWVSDWNP